MVDKHTGISPEKCLQYALWGNADLAKHDIHNNIELPEEIESHANCFALF
jgi:hypothetical protein